MRILVFTAAAIIILTVLWHPYSVFPGIIAVTTAALHLAHQVWLCTEGDDPAEHIEHHCRIEVAPAFGDVLFVVALGLGCVAVIDPALEIGIASGTVLAGANMFYVYRECTAEETFRPELRHDLVEV